MPRQGNWKRRHNDKQAFRTDKPVMFDATGKYVPYVAPTVRKFQEEREAQEAQLQSDFKKIKDFFKEKNMNIDDWKLTIDWNVTGSKAYRKEKIIVLGMNRTDRDPSKARTTLVHESIHATGKDHSEQYRSHRVGDAFSPAMERKIFGEISDKSFGQLHTQQGRVRDDHWIKLCKYRGKTTGTTNLFFGGVESKEVAMEQATKLTSSGLNVFVSKQKGKYNVFVLNPRKFTTEGLEQKYKQEGGVFVDE